MRLVPPFVFVRKRGKGMDWSFIQKFWPMYARAGLLTLRIGALGVACSMALGLLCCVARTERVPVLRGLSRAYIEVARNTPLLVQLFFLYFGLPKIGIKWSGEVCAIVGLTFQGGAYMAESFRSGLEAVERTQKEAGACLGLSGAQNFRYVILPQALATAVPSLCANIVFLIKETSVLSAVALADLMYVAKDLIGMYYKTDEALLMLVAAYLVILLPLSVLFTWIERRLRYAGFGAERAI